MTTEQMELIEIAAPDAGTETEPAIDLAALEAEAERIRAETEARIAAMQAAAAERERLRKEAVAGIWTQMENLALPALTPHIERCAELSAALLADDEDWQERKKRLDEEHAALVLRQAQAISLARDIVRNLATAYKRHSWRNYWTEQAPAPDEADQLAVDRFEDWATALFAQCPAPISESLPSNQTLRAIINEYTVIWRRNPASLYWSQAAKRQRDAS